MANSLNYSAIRDLCEKKKIKVKDLCAGIGITLQGLTTSLNTEKLSTDKVDSLCRYLEISPNYFFRWADFEITATENNTQLGIVNNQNIGNAGIELLHQQLIEKDKQIDKLLSLLNK